MSGNEIRKFMDILSESRSSATDIKISRFLNTVAIDAEGKTIFLSPESAEMLMVLLEECVHDIRKEPDFNQSTFGVHNIKTTQPRGW